MLVLVLEMDVELVLEVVIEGEKEEEVVQDLGLLSATHWEVVEVVLEVVVVLEVEVVLEAGARYCTK